MLASFASKISAKRFNFSQSEEEQERLTLIKRSCFSNSNDLFPLKWPNVFSMGALLIFHPRWRVLTFVSLLFGVLKVRSLSSPKILHQVFEEEALFFGWIN